MEIMEASQAQILDYCLKNCVFDGWGTKLLENACENTGQTRHYWQFAFPNGVVDVISYHNDILNAKMAECEGLDGLRTHEKIRELVKFRVNVTPAGKYKNKLPHSRRNLAARR
jgi:ubiquinone biosynthesis protein COQ9